MAKKKVSQKQKQKQTQKVIVNINQTAPKRKRARRKRGGEPVVYREFQKVIYSDANPIQIYENQSRYKNIDAKPVIKSNTIVQLEDVGQVGTEGPVEILPRTSKEQTADVEFVPLVAEAEKLPLNRRQGDNTEMRIPTNAASELMGVASDTEKKRNEALGQVMSNLFKNEELLSGESGGEYEKAMYQAYQKYSPDKTRTPRNISPNTKMDTEEKKREEARRRRNELARARYAKKKAKQGLD